MTANILLVVPDKSLQSEICHQFGFAAWSTAFECVLEKYGWISVDTISFIDLLQLKSVSNYKLAIVCWPGHEQDLLIRALTFLESSDILIIVEGPLSENPIRALGGTVGLGEPEFESFHENEELIPGDNLQPEWASRTYQDEIHSDSQLVLQSKDISTHPIGIDYNGILQDALADESISNSAGYLLLLYIHKLSSRFYRNGFVFKDIESASDFNIVLDILNTKLDEGILENRIREFIRDYKEQYNFPVENLSADRASELIINLSANPDQRDLAIQLTELIQSSTEKPLEIASVLKILDKESPVSMPVLIAASALSGIDVVKRVFKYLLNEQYDRDRSGFLNCSFKKNGDVVPGRGVNSQPLLLYSLAVLSDKIVIPHSGTTLRSRFNELQKKYWNSPPLVRNSLRVTNGVELLVFASNESPAITKLENGNIFTSFPLLAWLTHYHTMGPLEDSYYDANSLGFCHIEDYFLSIIFSLCKEFSITLPRIRPWPWPFETMISIRHDVDRIPEKTDFEKLLGFHYANNLGVTWCWLPWRTDKNLARKLCEENHEIALHSVNNLKKAWERDQILAISPNSNFRIGESYHGANSDFWLGASSVAEAIGAQMRFTEFAPNMIQFPYSSYPWLNEDLTIKLLRGTVGITHNYGTDANAGYQRKQRIISDRNIAQSLLNKGVPIILLNHPDINFDKLTDIVQHFKTSKCLSWSLGKIADWWSRTHTNKSIQITSSENKLYLKANSFIENLALEFPLKIISAQLNGANIQVYHSQYLGNDVSVISVTLQPEIQIEITLHCPHSDDCI